MAAQVLAELMPGVERSDDSVILIMAELEQQTELGPAVRLATSPEIDTAAEVIERRIERLRAREGRYLARMIKELNDFHCSWD